MRLSIVGVIVLSPFLLSGCSASDSSTAAADSIYTDLSAGSCKKEIDRTDPNETPYLACPGVAGYTLIVRHVDADRQSIDVVDPAQRVLPLNYQEVVTRYMATVDDKAEWRVRTTDGKQVPIALTYSSNTVRNTSAASYYNAAAAINDASQVRAGDLLVWMNGNAVKSNPGHVAVVESYVAQTRAGGNMRVVEATGAAGANPKLLDSMYEVEQIVPKGGVVPAMILVVKRHGAPGSRVVVIRV